MSDECSCPNTLGWHTKECPANRNAAPVNESLESHAYSQGFWDGAHSVEAQCEPSGPQVNRDYLAQVIHKAVYSRIPLDRLTDEAQNDTYKRADAVIAALRATGGVK